MKNENPKNKPRDEIDKPATNNTSIQQHKHPTRSKRKSVVKPPITALAIVQMPCKKQMETQLT